MDPRDPKDPNELDDAASTATSSDGDAPGYSGESQGDGGEGAIARPDGYQDPHDLHARHYGPVKGYRHVRGRLEGGAGASGAGGESGGSEPTGSQGGGGHDHDHDHDHDHRHEHHDHDHQAPARGRKGKRMALSHEIAKRWDPKMLARSLSGQAGSGQPLDPMTRARYERRLGADLGGVRVYTGEFAEQVTRQHSAEAVTIGGTGMILMSGTADRSPVSASGEALLAHELTHVAQSSRGMFRSAPGERPPLATEAHEAEAEAVEGEVLGAAANPERLEAVRIDREKQHELMVEQVTSRVLELMHEDERVHTTRNGESRHRA